MNWFKWSKAGSYSYRLYYCGL